ncbi:MAG TPA: pteridine-dependent deoxygenase [Rudaea sp.]|jgi:chorismate lyase/3-hydroxybenzoate synthase|nr:pteridine-dependent deoxygenase [Rudaea sp.]
MTDASVSNSSDNLNTRRNDVGRVLPSLRVSYESTALEHILAGSDVLAVVGFGSAAPANGDPRYLRVALEPLRGPAPFEVWRGAAPVIQETAGEVRWTGDGDYAFGVIEVDENARGGIAASARYAYCLLREWIAASRTPHVLRIWNYLDDINTGNGDAERYREFCRGRADGMTSLFEHGFPAATAIGVRGGRRVLQVYWLAARVRGAALENPRQVSAWRYPREHGPSAPTFARAMRAPTHSPQLYISGTAAIVGHVSHHHDDLPAQLDETLANFASLLEAAGVPARAHFGSHSVLKVYLRNGEDAGAVGARLRERLPESTPVLLLNGDICRRELLIEIDGILAG